MLALRLPSSEITVLAEGQPVRMRATAIEVVPVPPQGRDTVQFLGRRLLLVWSEKTEAGGADTEYFEASGTHMPAALSLVPHCCDGGAQRQGRRRPYLELAIPGERTWLGVDGVVTIHPPVLQKQCEKALEARLDGLGVMNGGCRRATFDVALDASLKQYPGEVAGPVRYRAIAPTSIKGVRFLVDCLDSNEGSLAVFCRPPWP